MRRLPPLGVAWASVSSGTVQTQEGARSDLDAKIISTVPHEGRRTRKLLGWFDDRRRERRARRGGKRLRRNLNISSPAISFAFTESIHRIAESSSMSMPRAAGYSCFPACPRRRASPPWPPTPPFPWPPGVNVLFIDLDLRRPVQSEMLGLSVKQKNELGTLLTESAAPEKILSAAVTDPATGLHSLLSTKSYTDVIELLASDQLAKVVALARERYDYVIIDSPPLGFFSDSELLSDLSDASVLVVRQDTVPAPEINDAIDALRAGKAEFLGCILNDMAHLAAWSSGYGYGYGKKYDKYGYGQHSARKTQ
ncbi:MAG: tyrosine-protein kinase family protein [Oscillospiraceae bacterium]